MAYSEIESQTLNRRAFFLAAGGAAAFTVLGARLYYLQVVRSEDYSVLSDKNRFNFNIIVPSRGRILDRNGSPLAINKQNYRVVIVPEQVENIQQTLDNIEQTIPLRTATRKRILKDIRENAGFIPVLVDENLDWASFAEINIRTPELAGVMPEVGEGRYYPNKGLFAHTLGYVGRAGPKDVKADPDPLLRQPTFRVGKTGVEATVDKRLRGESGRLKVEVNAVGRIVREWPDPAERSKAGEDVFLTLDANLQRYAAELFEEDSGGAVVIDINTGELRTLLSMPTFDGNLFVSGLTREDMARMNADEKRPQFNKVVGGGYPPASTFKMAVMLAGLKDGTINPREQVTCRGKIAMGNRMFHCWRREGHGRMDLRDSLKNSCDVYYYEMSQRIGISKIAEMGRLLGLGQRYEFGVQGQTEGIMPDENWKRQKLGQGWRMGDTLNAAIGQGFVLTSPLQLAVMTARLANGTSAISPYLIINDEVPKFGPLGIDPEHLALVQDAMWSVCEEPGGTAYRNNGVGIRGLQMAGKTGTGQVRGISVSERLSGVLHNRNLPWRLRDHSIFVGYAPYDSPRFAAATIVEHGGSGAGRAAHIVRNLLQRSLERDGMGTKPETRNRPQPTRQSL